MTARALTYVLLFLLLEAALIAFVDRPLSDDLRTLDTTQHNLIDFFRFYTNLGLSKWYLWPTGLGVIFFALALRGEFPRPELRPRVVAIGWDFLFIFVAVAASGIVTDIIKPILGRARPVVLARENFYGFHPFTAAAAWNSMPSGHATTAFALAGALILLFPRERRWWFAYALFLALSRIMVNAHFLSDVIAGAAVGWGTASLSARLFASHGMLRIKRRLFPIDS